MCYHAEKLPRRRGWKNLGLGGAWSESLNVSPNRACKVRCPLQNSVGAVAGCHVYLDVARSAIFDVHLRGTGERCKKAICLVRGALAEGPKRTTQEGIIVRQRNHAWPCIR